MSERGSSKHGPRIDGQLKHEDQPIVQGHGPSHVEEWREAEGVPDDTDSPETERAYRMHGSQLDASDAASDPRDPDDPGDFDLPRANEPKDPPQPGHLGVGDLADPESETNRVTRERESGSGESGSGGSGSGEDGTGGSGR